MTAIEMIAEKARTNREHKGYTAEHDDTHTHSELVQAAMCYLDGVEDVYDLGNIPPPWPFEPESWKPSDDPIRNLVHAGALIVAEIERLQRLKKLFAQRGHTLSCPAYGNYQPPYADCTCGAEKV